MSTAKTSKPAAAKKPTPSKPGPAKAKAVAKTMTPAEAAEALGTTPRAVRRLIRLGKLAAVERGSRWEVPVAAVEERRAEAAQAAG